MHRIVSFLPGFAHWESKEMKMFDFTKMHGAGNDFVLIDDRSETFPIHDHIRLAALASARTGIGCEGVILIQPSANADFRMRFFNPDGTEVEMCGNGSRCAAAFAYEIGASKSKAMTMETMTGLLDAEVLEGGLIRVWMPEPKNRNYDLHLNVDGEVIAGNFIQVGVPHFVVEAESISKVDVAGLGRALRLSEQFAPGGTNVDFVQYITPKKLSMRTYERGVEAESGACGTGAMAAAVVAVETHQASLPIHVRTSCGFDLVIDGDWRNSKSTGFTLTGPTKKVFTGEIDLDSIDVGNEME